MGKEWGRGGRSLSGPYIERGLLERNRVAKGDLEKLGVTGGALGRHNKIKVKSGKKLSINPLERGWGEKKGN